VKVIRKWTACSQPSTGEIRDREPTTEKPWLPGNVSDSRTAHSLADDSFLDVLAERIATRVSAKLICPGP
jgi:hypothetical protein